MQAANSRELFDRLSTLPGARAESLAVERRGLTDPVEYRAEPTGAHIVGYAAVYAKETIIMGLWREQIAPGAFATALDGTDDVRALFNHDPNYVLGRSAAGTLVLTDSAKGLKYDIALNPDDPDAQRVRAKIQRGDVSGSSFGFTVDEDDWDERPTKQGKLPLRTISKVSLFDVSPVTYPAYPQTSVSARSRGEASSVVLRLAQATRREDARRELVRLRVRIERARSL